MKKVSASREKRVWVAVLNVKVHSELPNRYERLFELISAIKHVKVRGSEFGTIGYLKKTEENFLVGDIYLFLNIDPKEEWYDAEKRIAVDPDAIGMETQIFERLKPHLKKRAYAFDLRNHSLYYDSSGFSPNVARQFFEKLCKQADISQEVGEVDIKIQASKQSIDDILAMKNMIYLEVFLTKLNPEGLTQAQEELHQELVAEGVISRKEIIKSTKELGIKPQNRTKNLVYLSRNNGYAHAQNFVNDQLITLRTEDHPEVIAEGFFIKTERPLDALLRVAENIYQNLSK